MISSIIHAGGAAMLTAIIVAFMCLPGILGAWMAKTRGRGMVTWFLLCMVLPLIAHIALLALPRRYRWTCPACEGGACPTARCSGACTAGTSSRGTCPRNRKPTPSLVLRSRWNLRMLPMLKPTVWMVTRVMQPWWKISQR